MSNRLDLLKGLNFVLCQWLVTPACKIFLRENHGSSHCRSKPQSDVENDVKIIFSEWLNRLPLNVLIFRCFKKLNCEQEKVMSYYNEYKGNTTILFYFILFIILKTKLQVKSK